MYLFHVHRVDWYSKTWAVGVTGSLTVRPKGNIRVMGGEHEMMELMEQRVAELRERTKLFMVLLQPKMLN